MQNEKYLELDALAAPNGYVAPPMKEDLAYVVHFRKTCQRYQIDFAKADPDERDFVIHMAEKTFLLKTPLQSELPGVGHSGVFLISLVFSMLSRLA
mgnify:FL=1